jgi:hypothetical protein
MIQQYQKECKSAYNKDTCTPMFTAASFIISKLCKQFRCPTTDELVKNIYIYNGILFSYKEE